MSPANSSPNTGVNTLVLPKSCCASLSGSWSLISGDVEFKADLPTLDGELADIGPLALTVDMPLAGPLAEEVSGDEHGHANDDDQKRQ
jgi:hypothetical protein